MAPAPSNPVLWPLRARPTGRSSPPWLVWLARFFLLNALCCVGLGLAAVPGPVPERVEADVWLIANLPTETLRKRVEQMGRALEGQPGVHSVTIRAEAEPRWLEQEIDELLQQQASRPRVALFIRPMTRTTDLDEWARRAERCRAADLAVGVVVVPAESLPGATVGLPRRTTAFAGDQWGTLSVMPRNLDQLDRNPGGSTNARLEVIAHGEKAAWHLPALQREFGGYGLDTFPVGSPTPTRLVLDVDKLLAALPEQPRQPRMLYPINRPDLLRGPVDGIEVVLECNGRVIDRHFASVEAIPPEVLLLPLAALAEEPLPATFPRLPQRPGQPTGSRADRPLWNLLWQDQDALGGVEVYWPSAPKGVGKVRTELPQTVEELQRYRAVVLDASVPHGLFADLELSEKKSTDPAHAGQYEWHKIRYYPGFLVRTGPTAARQKQQLVGFLQALARYWKQGGTVMLIGGHPACLEAPAPPPGVAFAINLRGVVRDYFDPQLDSFEPALPPRRLLLAHDNTETAARLSAGTLPPLPDEDMDLPAGVFTQRQCLTWFGFVPLGSCPGRSRWTQEASRRLGLQGPGLTGDQELATLLRDTLPDSAVEFFAQQAEELAVTFAHPGLMVELQGRPLFRRGYRAFRTRKDYPPGEWLGADLPFSWEKPGDKGPFWRDRYSTVFRRLKTATSHRGLEDHPELANGNLVDGLNAERFVRYLHEQLGDKPIVEMDDPRRGREVALAFLHRRRFELDRAGGKDIQWPLLQQPGPGKPPYPRETSSYQPLPALTRHHFLFFGSGEAGTSWTDLLKRCFIGVLPTRADWWAPSIDPFDPADDYWHRLLFMGRGRFQLLLRTALARDVQALPCAVKADLGSQWARGSSAGAEVADLSGRIVHERLRLSFTPALQLRLTPGNWRALVEARDGNREVPVVVAASSPATPNGLPGQLLWALLDPEYEAMLHGLRDLDLRSWTDVSATTVFSGGNPKKAALGLVLRTNTAHTGSEGVVFEVTAHAPRVEGPPHLLDEKPIEVAGAEVAVRVHPHLGLTGPGSAWLVPRAGPVSPSTHRIADAWKRAGRVAPLSELTSPTGTPAPVPLPFPRQGLAFLLTREQIQTLTATALAGEDTSRRFPQLLPLLLEFRIKGTVYGETNTLSVFAPIPPAFWSVQEQNHLFGTSLDHAAPAAQLIDLLLEGLGKPTTYRVEPRPDGRSFRITPGRPGTALPPANQLKIHLDAPGGRLLARGDYQLEERIPGQWLVHFPERSNLLRKRLVVTLPDTFLFPETARIYLPGPCDDTDGFRPVIPGNPAGSRFFPREEDLLLDTLVLGTIPEVLRNRLDRAETTAREWRADTRGVLVSTIAEGTAEEETFARDFVESRTRTHHHRLWFLFALLLLVFATGCRRLGGR